MIRNQDANFNTHLFNYQELIALITFLLMD
jgi:hypothetical protein